MIANLQGYVSIMVHNDIRIDITVDGAIRMVNNKVNMKLSITPSEKISALLSPAGTMCQYGSRIETVGFGKGKTNNKISRDNNRIQMKTSLKGTSCITTPFVHCLCWNSRGTKTFICASWGT